MNGFLHSSNPLPQSALAASVIDHDFRACATPGLCGTHSASAAKTTTNVTPHRFGRPSRAAAGGFWSVLWSIRILVRCALRSRSTSRNMSDARKQRMQTRQSFFLHANPSIIINTPGPYREDQFRTNAFSEVRARIEKTNSPQELLQHLSETMAKTSVEASVFSAAAQRCGKGRWWHALVKVHALQQNAGIPLNGISVSIFLTALAACTREEKLGTIRGRCEHILSMAKDLWSEHQQQHMELIAVVSALRLCWTLQESEALSWAEQLWTMSKCEDYHLDMMVCSQYAQVLASHKLHDKVDELLQAWYSKPNIWLAKKGFEHTVLLSGLLNISAGQKDWQRADELWERFVDVFDVEPNALTYNAWAKVHFLCGRPNYASCKLDQIFANKMSITANIAEQHAQALLVTYHSTLSRLDLHRLTQSLRRGDPLLQKAGAFQKKTWTRIKNTARRLESKASSVCLQDVLINWLARTSQMSSWGRLPAGSNYLPPIL